MKALLLKDWYVLRKQAWAYLIIVLVWGAIPSEVLNLLAVVYGAMVPYSAMAYDQRSRWDRFARMLPYSDRTVVLSRYALGWISLSVGAFAVAICQGVLTCLPLPAKLSANLSPGFVFAALCVGCLLLDLNIPLILRYGTEKARWVAILITFLTFASVGALNGLVNDAKTVAAAVLSLTLAGMLAHGWPEIEVETDRPENGRMLERYAIEGWPAFVLIAPDGTIAARGYTEAFFSAKEILAGALGGTHPE